MTIQDLRPNPQDTSAFYLENIYQLLADTNVFPASLPSSVLKPPPFSPPRYAIWVNSLWFSSLAISLTSALLATLLQQWARRYVKVTRPRCRPRDRARVRAFFFENTIKKLHLLWAADAVPTLLHLSLLLFFAGLLILLRNTNHTVFNAVVGWVALCITVYAYITLLPIFRSFSPYYGPLSSIGWQLYASVRRLMRCKYRANVPERLLGRVERIAKDEASQMAEDIDVYIVNRTLDALHDDHVKEHFFGVIPGFYNSEAGKRIQGHPDGLFSRRFMRSLNEFLDHTLSLDSISESVRSSRLSICLNAANTGLDSLDPCASSQITHRIIFNDHWYEVPPSVETRYILRRWTKSDNKHIVASGRCVIARVIAKAWKYDETWMALAMDQLGVSEDVLKDYLAHGNSVLLANLINITRLFFENKFPYLDVLGSVSKFSVEGVLPDLQRQFCTLWNEIVQDDQLQPPFNDSSFILKEIRAIYNALHPSSTTGSIAEDNDHPSSTPNHPLPCTDPDNLSSHHPTSTNSTTYKTQDVPYRGALLISSRSISHHSAATVTSPPIPPDTA